MMVWDPRWALDVRSLTVQIVGDPINDSGEAFWVVVAVPLKSPECDPGGGQGSGFSHMFSSEILYI